MKKTILPIVLLLLIALPSIFALLRPGFFVSDDGEWMIIRFTAFYQALADGQFPVRFLSRLNNEYGYPVANFLYPGFMYLGVPVKLLGIDFVSTIKIIIGGSLIGSSLFTFLWLKKIFNTWAAFVGAILYLYSPYHLFDAYTRGSVGELLSLAILPFVLWQIERQSILFASFGVGLLLISHNTIAILSLPIIVLYMLMSYRVKKKAIIAYKFVVMIIAGFGLAAFFWIPALVDLQYTRFSQTVVSDWSHYFAPLQLIGAITVGLVILFVVLWIRKKIILTEKDRLFFALFAISLFLSLSVSSIFWRALPVSFIQFPYRLLSIFILASAFIGALLVHSVQKRKELIGIVLILISFLSTMPYLLPKTFVFREEGYYTTNMDTTTVKKEYMPKWVKQTPSMRSQQKVAVQMGTAELIFQNANEILFKTSNKSKKEVFIHTIYFPGWKVFVNNSEVPIDYNNDKGMIHFTILSGESMVKVQFQETRARLVSDAISIISFILLLLWSLRTKWRHFHL